jgi:hypothetical protein
MSPARLAAFATTLCCALLLGGAGSATAAGTADSAQAAQPLTKVIPMTGEARNGKKFNGTFTIKRFASRGGELQAVGKLKGRLKNRRVNRTVRLPAELASGAQSAQIPPTTGACQILNLTIQPIDLNLLGLRVRTSRIDLLIEGVPGPGNLLGNLLCGITGLLDPNSLANTTLGQLVQILNALLALSPRTA